MGQVTTRYLLERCVGHPSSKLPSSAGWYQRIPGADQNECWAAYGLEPWAGVEAQRQLALRTITRQVKDGTPHIRACDLGRAAPTQPNGQTQQSPHAEHGPCPRVSQDSPETEVQTRNQC